MKQGFTRLLFVLVILLGGLLGANRAIAQGWSVTCPGSSVTRLYVDGALTASGNGGSWAQALTTVSEALAIANQCTGVNEIWVKAGAYYPMVSATAKATSRDSSFRILRNGIKLYGGFAGTESNLSQRNIKGNPTVLSGDLGTLNDSTDNSYNVVLVSAVVAMPSATPSSVISGFLITGGNGNSNYPGTSAINTRNQAGGVLIRSASGLSTNIEISDCVVRTNFGVYGGGICSWATGISGQVNLSVLRSAIVNNRSVYGGGTMTMAYPAAATGTNEFVNCVFTNNSVIYSGSSLAMSSDGAGCALTTNATNCTFYNEGQDVFFNILQNTGTSAANVRNSIVWNQTGTYASIVNGPGVSFADCNLAIAPAGSNISALPLFVNPQDGDGADNIWGTADDGLRLGFASPLLNRANNTWVQASNAVDIAGASRIQQGTVEHGAYEGGHILCPASSRLYVNGQVVTSGAGTGWANALKTVWEALTIANNCPGVNEIWVRSGTYYPMVNMLAAATSRDSSFRILRNGIKLYGGFAGTENALSARNVATNPTILSGDLGTPNNNSDNSYHVVTVVGGVTGPIDTTTRIDGFTISHGNANGNSSPNIYGIYSISGDGGGIAIIGSGSGNNSSPLIANCNIADNNANVGGGAYAGAYYDGSSSPYFINCTIRNNAAYDVGGIHAHTSGNLRTGTQQPRYYNCRFLNNTATSGAGAVGFYNNGPSTNNIYMANCVFQGNAVSDYGGAINTYTSNCHFTMVGCIFTGNTAGQAGGAMSIGNGGSATMRNCTFSDNTASTGAATINQGSQAIITLENSIVWGASNTQVAPTGTVNYRFSDVRGITAPTNSLNIDPLFVNASDPDGADNIWGTADDGLQLQRCSPVIDKGSNSLVPAALTTDFAGATRTQQLAVDMGAYETPWINSNLVISTSSSYDPSTCSGTDGRIGFGAVPVGLSYTINYSRNGIAQPPVTAISDASGQVLIPNLSAGRYSAFSFTLNGCTSNGPVVNIDLIDPPVPLISGISGISPTTCGGQNGSVTLTGLTNGVSYLVNFSRGGIAQPAQTLMASSNSVTIQSLTAGRYTDFTVTVNNCTSPLVPGPVILNDPAAPVAPAPSSNAPVCSGATLNLNSGTTPAGASYSWSGPNGFTSTTQNPSITPVQAANAGTYQLVVSVANCPSAPGSVNVVVNPLPQNVVAASNSPVCEGSTLQLTGSSSSTGVTFSWTGPGGFTSSTASPGISGATTAAGGTYSLRVTSAANCSFTVLANVTIQPIPAISGVTGTNPTTCNGTSGTLTITGLTASTSYSVTYLKGTASQSVTASSDATGAIVLTGIGRGSYSNFIITINGCASASFAGPVVLTDPPAPAAPVASSNSPVCEASTLNLSVAGATGASFNWAGPNGFTSSSATPAIPGMTSANAGTYNVTQTVNGCISPMATTVVVMSALPAQPGSITGPASPCLNSTNSYSVASVAGAGSYVWTIPATWTSTGSTTNSISAATGASGGAISVAAVNGCGTGTARTLTVTVNNVPATAGAITGPTAICNGVATGYSITAVSNTSGYTWVLPNGWSGSSTSTSITATPDASSGTIQVIPNNVCGSGNSQALNVTVTSIPARPGTITGNATPCVNTPQLYYIAAVNGAASYNWTFPTGGNPAWSGAASSTSLNSVVGASSGNVSVTATNRCGTSPAATLAIAVTQLPSAAGTITGPAAPCVGTTPTYSIAQVQNATSYNWTFPASWSGTPGNTNTIRLSTGSGSGTITVTPVGVCGNGAPSSIQVSGTPIVTPTVSISRSTPTDTICGGTPVTFRARATNAGPNPVFEFRRNGILLASGSIDTFRTTALANGDRITVNVISSLPCVNKSMASDSTRMFVLPVRTPGININTFPPTVLCSGQTVTLHSNDTNGGANPRYEWYLNGEKIEGVTSSDYTPSSINNGDTFQVVLTSDVVCAKYTIAPSNKVGFSVTPVVTPTVSISMDPAGPIARGAELTFTATASNGGSNPQFQWFRNGAPISAATGSVWKSSSLVSGDEISVRMLSVATCATPELVISNGIRVTISSTGVANTALNASVRLYPNPNTGHFSVEVSDMAIKPGLRSGIAVLNPLGQIVYHMTFQPDRSSWSHDVLLKEGLANGTYLLRVYSEQGGATAIPFILNR